ncbi:hypothetical protein GCM10018780_50580 [Streptomyces lanatus]|nr:hypothetical protein GCM10018780_50580 [Streptomyces lanatus]
MCGERVEARRLAVGEARDEFGGGARIAVHGTQYAHADAFGKARGQLVPRVRRLSWRSAVERWGVHRSHHTKDVTGGLVEA